MANIVFPPTPASSIPSPATDGSTHTDHFEKHTKMYPQPGPSTFAPTMPHLPPTPPADDPTDLQHLSLYDNQASSSQRVRPGRRAASASPSPAGEEEVMAFPPPRKLTDPHPRPRGEGVYQQHEDTNSAPRQPLDVDLDAYSTFGDSREPTLSFVTTLTNDSTTGTPSLGHKRDGEGSGSGEGEPRIRTRSTVGRSTAYSSAESSGAYSYHAYENQVFHPHPPPLPKTPQPHSHARPHHDRDDRVGLGLSNSHHLHDHQAASNIPSSSSTNSFGHLPWQSDVANRLRSGSNASSASHASHSSQDYSSSLRHYEYHYNDALPWEIQQAQDNEPEAVAMVEEGRERTMDMAKLQEMGGLSSLTDDKIAALSGITHLLLSRCGTGLVQVLPSLLAVLAPTLVVLDISHNAFTTLPDELRQCLSLEELNVSSNPLRSVPPFIGGLFNLRQVQLDQCTLQSLPVEMQDLMSLHTLCLRRNRLVALPAWLCQLDCLETLKVDENPFAREWVNIVAPILAKRDSTNGSQTPAPYIPPRTSSQRPEVRTATSSASLASSINSAQSVKDYIVSPAMHSDTTSPAISATTSTAHLDAIAEDAPHSAPLQTPEQYTLPQPRMKRMKSAGNLFENRFQSSPILRTTRAESDAGFNRPATSTSAGHTPVSSPLDAGAASTSTGKTGKSWGFLRKMSMNRLRSSDKTATLSNSAASNIKLMPPALPHTTSEPLQTHGRPSLRGAMSAMTLPSRNGSVIDIGEFGQQQQPPQSRLGPSATVPLNGLPSASGMFGGMDRSKTPSRGKRRSFLPIDTPPSISLAIPSTSPLMPATIHFGSQGGSAPPSDNGISELSHRFTMIDSSVADGASDPEAEAQYSAALESIKSYLRDLFDLGRPEIEPYGGFEVVGNGATASHPQTPNSNVMPESPLTTSSAGRGSMADTRHTVHSDVSDSAASTSASGDKSGPRACVKKVKDDKAKRAKVLREIYETERTYVRGLGELVTIYVRPSGQAVTPGKQPFESVVPSGERKIVFGGIESILTIHRDNLLPSLERAIRDLVDNGDDDDGTKSQNASHAVGEVFRTYIAYMKQYSTYINNFDNAMSRMKTWTSVSSGGPPGSSSGGTTFGGSLRSSGGGGGGGGIGAATIGASLSAVSLPVADTVPHTGSSMTTAQRKRVKAFLKRCRAHPMHSQINLESYLLLPIQRVPRYKLLLEDLAMCTPFREDGNRDTLDDALREISSLASLMNEEKREADSRLRLYHWQKRIASKGPSPLVQPHRKLVLDGTLVLIRLVKKAASYVEVDNTVIPTTANAEEGEHTIMPSKIVVPVEHIVPEPLDKQMVLILCSDMLILAQQRTPEFDDGKIDLFNVLRLSTVKAPASVVGSTTLRVVDNRSIYYFHAESDAEALKWCRAINSARKR